MAVVVARRHCGGRRSCDQVLLFSLRDFLVLASGFVFLASGFVFLASGFVFLASGFVFLASGFVFLASGFVFLASGFVFLASACRLSRSPTSTAWRPGLAERCCRSVRLVTKPARKMNKVPQMRQRSRLGKKRAASAGHRKHSSGDAARATSLRTAAAHTTASAVRRHCTHPSCVKRSLCRQKALTCAPPSASICGTQHVQRQTCCGCLVARMAPSKQQVARHRVLAAATIIWAGSS
eukprot:scaffold9332_cov113-Isochrysis_galbana.AAC.3